MEGIWQRLVNLILVTRESGEQLADRLGEVEGHGRVENSVQRAPHGAVGGALGPEEETASTEGLDAPESKRECAVHAHVRLGSLAAYRVILVVPLVPVHAQQLVGHRK